MLRIQAFFSNRFPNVIWQKAFVPHYCVQKQLRAQLCKCSFEGHYLCHLLSSFFPGSPLVCSPTSVCEYAYFGSHMFAAKCRKLCRLNIAAALILDLRSTIHFSQPEKALQHVLTDICQQQKLIENTAIRRVTQKIRFGEFLKDKHDQVIELG